MTSNYQLDMDSGTVDSVTSTPRSEASNRLHDELQPRIRFMCSFGGQILPRPHDNQLRYVGGDTRIVAVNRSISYSSLLAKLSKLSTTPEFTVKYQLPNEDLDALISVSTDEDVENMIDEYDRLIQTQGTNPKLARLRLFMFPVGNSLSCTSSIGSLLDGSTKRENWFLDALNGGGGSASLERVRSEASSIVSEVPDYLFGLDNSEETTRGSKFKTRPILTDNISVSDPGSPAPPISSPYGSNSSSAIPNLPPVKTKPTNPISIIDSNEEPRDPMVQQQAGYPPGNPVWHYMPETHFQAPPSIQQMPVYYVQQSPVHHHQVHQQPVHMQPPAQYVQRFQASVGQIPVGYRHNQVPNVGQMYGGGGMRPVTHVEAAAAYEYSTPNTGGVMPEQGGIGQQTMYYGTRNTPMMQTYAAGAASTMVQGGGTDLHQMLANPNTHKDSQQAQ